MNPDTFRRSMVHLNMSLSLAMSTPALTHLSFKERRFLDYLRKKRIDEFTPIEMAKVMKVSNRTIIKALSQRSVRRDFDAKFVDILGK